MLTEISPNKSELNSRIFFQFVMLAALLYFVYIIIFPTEKHPLPQVVIKHWCLLIIALLFNVNFFLQLYFLPFWVIIDDELKTLEIKYLMSPSKTVSVQDITSYSDITIKSRSSSSFGMLLYLSNGKTVLLGDINFDNYTPVETFINNFNVKKLGEEEFSFLSYYMSQ